MKSKLLFVACQYTGLTQVLEIPGFQKQSENPGIFKILDLDSVFPITHKTDVIFKYAFCLVSLLD